MGGRSVNDEPRSVMVLNASFMAALLYPDNPECAEYYERMVYTLAHECGHAHDLAMKVKMFPGVMLKLHLPQREAVLLGIASGCWDEYIASRLSAHFGGDQTTQDYEDTFCSALKGAKDRADSFIRQYRMHRELTRLLDEVIPEYRRVLVYASYLLGHLDGLGKSVEESAPKANELVRSISLFTSFFDRLRSELILMESSYGQWTTLDVYEPLKQIAYDLLKVGGLDLQHREEGMYVNVPFTAETMPSVSEEIEFRMLKKASAGSSK